MKGSKLWPGILALAILPGCRVELADLTYQLDATEPLVISRTLLADKALEENPGTSFSVALGGCIHAPTAWGAPTAVIVSGTAEGSPFTAEPPATDAASATAAAGAFAISGNTWYCYSLGEDMYNGSDTGKITWTFAAGSDPAKVATAVGRASSLQNIVIHDVTRTTLSEGMWTPLTVTLAGDTPQVAGSSQALIPVGTFGNLAVLQRVFPIVELLLAEPSGTLTVAPLPFQPIYFSFTPPTNAMLATSPTRMLAFFNDGGEARAMTSTDGINWTSGGLLPDNRIAFAYYNAGISQFVVGLEGDPVLYYSTDGASWGSIADTLASGTANSAYAGTVYASLPNGAEAVLMANGTTDSSLYVRPANGTFVEAPLRPGDSSLNWQVTQIISAGGRFYTQTRDPNGGSGPEYTLFTSSDGSTWTEIVQESVLSDGLLVGAADGDAVVLVYNRKIYASSNAGATFTDVTAASNIDAVIDLASARPLEAFVLDGRLYVSIEIGSPELATSLLLSTADGTTFDISASQLPTNSLIEFSYFPLLAGGTLMQVGESPSGFRAYRQVAYGSSTGGSGGGDSGGSGDSGGDSGGDTGGSESGSGDSEGETIDLNTLLSTQGSGGGTVWLPLLVALGLHLRRRR